MLVQGEMGNGKFLLPSEGTLMVLSMDMPKASGGDRRRVRVHLRELLERSNLSMKAFSEQSGICYPSVHDLCRDRVKRLDLQTLESICSTLGCDPADVLKISDGSTNTRLLPGEE